MIVYLLQKVLIILLNIKKINIFTKYFNFANIFLFNSIVELPEYTSINNYLINLIRDK